jgi:glycosyltransferase involved in cell wall biosynthesis
MQAQSFARAGHDVVWWISNFDHRSKKFRAADWDEILIDDGTKIKVVPSTSYSRHISLRRIAYERLYARRVVERAALEKRPDVVVIVEPALFYGKRIERWCNEQRIPIIVDIVDLWPELFRIVLPTWTQSAERLLFWPLYQRRRNLLRQAVGVAAVSRDYLAPVSDAAARCPTVVTYIGGSEPRVTSESLANLRLPPRRGDNEIWFVYAGTLGEAYEIDRLLRAIRSFVQSKPAAKFLIAGDGPFRAQVEGLAALHPEYVRYLGVLGPAALDALYSVCDVGLSSYAPGSTVAMPTKFYDYLFSGLAVLNSLPAECGSIVSARGCGWNFEPGNVDTLTQAFEHCCTYPVETRRRGLAAREASRDFVASEQCDRFVEFVTALVGVSRGG